MQHSVTSFLCRVLRVRYLNGLELNVFIFATADFFDKNRAITKR